MQFRRQRSEPVDVNLAPLIDVVFLLLIFFMVSTTFTKETHLSINLPEATGEKAVKLPHSIEIVIDARGHFSINNRSLVSDKIGTVMAALKDVSGGNSKQPLIITADAMTPHQAVVTAMDAAGQLGFTQLSLTTRRPTE